VQSGRELCDNPFNTYERNVDEGVLGLMLARANLFSERVALSVREHGQYREVTYAELNSRARALSDYLLSRGRPTGHRIAIFSEGRPEWAIAFFAAIRAGAQIVPLDPKLSVSELARLASEARIQVLFASPALTGIAEAAAAAVPSLDEIYVLGAPGEGSSAIHAISIDQIAEAPPAEAAERRADEVALVVYTSGTTGQPRGVMIRFSSIVFQVAALSQLVPVAPGDVFLSMLPLSHMLELTVGLLCVLYRGGEVCYARTLLPEELARIVAERKVTQLVTVPLFLKLLKGEAERGALRPSWLIHRVFVGGSPLDPALEDFFESAGIEVVQGYGLTECSPVVAGNSAESRKRGTVGQPLPGVEVKIVGADGASGEIWTRGPHLMQGYLNDEEATRAVIDENGWLKTGDLGNLDADGFLSVTGRVKNTIVLGSGLKVQPEEIEGVLETSPLFGDTCVLGAIARDGLSAGSEEVCAVIVPADRGASLAEITREVANRCNGLAAHKRPTRVVLHSGPLPYSASRKVRRPELLAWLEGRPVGVS
jgi:long-chain acyl-CoA synthetase